MSKPPLKLKIRSSQTNPDTDPAPAPASAMASTPIPSSSGQKLKIKFAAPKQQAAESSSAGQQQPTTSKIADSAPVASASSAAATVPPSTTAKKTKIILSQKRKKADGGEANGVEVGEDDNSVGRPRSKKQRREQKKIMVKLKNSKNKPSKPRFVARMRGQTPKRELGVGYDSEASDREEDPALEEEIILRMKPGEDCEYLRKAIEERRFGLKRDGGADVWMKFLQKDGRRAVVSIQGRLYAAALVDLPCIIEGMKSWDKKGWWKSADICQMLLVLGRCADDTESRHYPLPRELEGQAWQYPHGLTPPMHWVRKRRFRKRISNRTIEAVEDEVDRLLEADQNCAEYVRWDIIDPAREAQESEEVESEDADGPRHLLDNGGIDEQEFEDAEGEEDEETSYVNVNDNGEVEIDANENSEMADALQLELEKAFMEQAATPSMVEVSGIGDSSAVETPAGNVAETDETSGDDDEDDDGGDEDEDEPEDDDAKEEQAKNAQMREEMADLRAAIKAQQAEYDRQTNTLLRSKIAKKIQSLKADLQLKLDFLGEGDDDAD